MQSVKVASRDLLHAEAHLPPCNLPCLQLLLGNAVSFLVKCGRFSHFQHHSIIGFWSWVILTCFRVFATWFRNKSAGHCAGAFCVNSAVFLQWPFHQWEASLGDVSIPSLWWLLMVNKVSALQGPLTQAVIFKTFVTFSFQTLDFNCILYRNQTYSFRIVFVWMWILKKRCFLKEVRTK